jgi:hypothetical protein
MDLRQLESALDSLSILRPSQLLIHHAEVFFYVANHPYGTYADIEEVLNLSNTTVSRTVHALGDTHRKGYEGLCCLGSSQVQGKAAASLPTTTTSLPTTTISLPWPELFDALLMAAGLPM